MSTAIDNSSSNDSAYAGPAAAAAADSETVAGNGNLRSNAGNEAAQIDSSGKSSSVSQQQKQSNGSKTKITPPPSSSRQQRRSRPSSGGEEPVSSVSSMTLSSTGTSNSSTTSRSGGDDNDGDAVSVSSYRSSASMRSSGSMRSMGSARSRNIPSGMETRMRKRAEMRIVFGGQMTPSPINNKKNAVAGVSAATVAAGRQQQHEHQSSSSASSSRSVASSSSPSQSSMMKDEIMKLRREKVEMQQAHEFRIQQLESELASFRHRTTSSQHPRAKKNRIIAVIKNDPSSVIEQQDDDDGSSSSTDTGDTGDGTAIINNTTVATVEKLTAEQEELKQQLQEAQKRIQELEGENSSSLQRANKDISVEQLKAPSKSPRRGVSRTASSSTHSSGHSSSTSLSPERSARLEELRNSRRSREVYLKELVQEQQHQQQIQAASNPVDVTDVATVIVNLKDELMAAHEVIRQQRSQLEAVFDTQNHTTTLAGRNNGQIGPISPTQSAGEQGGGEMTDSAVVYYSRDVVSAEKYRKLQARYSQLQADRAWGEFRLRDRITDDALKFHRRLKYWKDECNTLQLAMKDQSEQHMDQLVQIRTELQMHKEKAQEAEDNLQQFKLEAKSKTEQLLQAQETIASLETKLESILSVHVDDSGARTKQSATPTTECGDGEDDVTNKAESPRKSFTGLLGFK